jgi:hypothetical protein
MRSMHECSTRPPLLAQPSASTTSRTSSRSSRATTGGVHILPFSHAATSMSRMTPSAVSGCPSSRSTWRAESWSRTSLTRDCLVGSGTRPSPNQTAAAGYGWPIVALTDTGSFTYRPNIRKRTGSPTRRLSAQFRSRLSSIISVSKNRAATPRTLSQSVFKKTLVVLAP